MCCNFKNCPNRDFLSNCERTSKRLKNHPNTHVEITSLSPQFPRKPVSRLTFDKSMLFLRTTNNKWNISRRFFKIILIETPDKIFLRLLSSLAKHYFIFVSAKFHNTVRIIPYRERRPWSQTPGNFNQNNNLDRIKRSQFQWRQSRSYQLSPNIP